MAALDDVLAKAYNITNRPDLNIETTQAANRALNYCHMGRPSPNSPNSEFTFDLVEGTSPVPIDPSTGTNALNFTITLPARFRGPRFQYLYADPPTNSSLRQNNQNKQIDYVPAKGLFDRQSLLKQADCYYIAGVNVRIRTNVPRENLYYGFLQNPSWADSFIGQNFSDVLAWKTAAEVFAMLDDNRKTYYEGLVTQQLMELQSSYQYI